MIQFTEKDLATLRERLRTNLAILPWLKAQVSDHLQYGIIIPETGLATWMGYYYCPRHSVHLEFNYQDPNHHLCPVDGELLSGEPYDGAWWRNMNKINAVACHQLALLWVLSGERPYFNAAKTILTGYARYYPAYEVHGGIPYNQPGKVNAQTLCDAEWIKGLAFGYDLISQDLSVAERDFIEQDLFTACAEFLKEHRTEQLHNHEVIIGSAIAILGVLLQRDDLIDFALNSRYGLKYHLDHAVLNDFMWFEGSINYQFYPLQEFMAFEKFALHTPYGLLNHPSYLGMLKFPLKLVQPDNTLPLLNDTHPGACFAEHASVYEFAYRVYGGDELAWILNQCYPDRPRNNIDAFLYGVANLPPVPELTFENYHNEAGSGLTVFRGRNQQYLLVKHSPFGGEHDHYDRLGISFSACGEAIAPDLGTTGYGALLHYDYFKNTGSHNTVMVNEANQPPANCQVLHYSQAEGYWLLDTEVRWDGAYPGLDSFTIVQWDEESYRNVVFRRRIAWQEEYFVDLCQVTGVSDKPIDWIIHVRGDLRLNFQLQPVAGDFSTKKPFKFLKNACRFQPEGVFKSSWALKNCQFDLYSYSPNRSTVYYAAGPDNPSTQDISYLIHRVTGAEAVFVNVCEAHSGAGRIVQDVGVSVAKGRVEIQVTRCDAQTDVIGLDL